jgi:hypothetical protein
VVICLFKTILLYFTHYNAIPCCYGILARHWVIIVASTAT